MNNINNVEFAVVTCALKGGYGFAEIESGKKIFFHLNRGRFIEAGRHAPKFGLRKLDKLPRKNDYIVFIRSQEEQKGNKPEAVLWGMKFFWDKMIQEISNRPFFKVTGQNYFKGSPSGPEETLVEGTLLDINEQFPPKGYNDPLGPEYRSGPVIRIQTWHEFNAEKQEYFKVRNPREAQTFPAPVAKPAAEKVSDSELMALAASTSGRNTGTKQVHKTALQAAA